jgi:hypothetical protein
MWRTSLLTLALALILAVPASAVTVQTVTLASVKTSNTGAVALCKDSGNPSGVNTCNVANVKNATTATIQVFGTGAFTVTFQTSVDGTNFVSKECFTAADRTVSVTSTTTSGAWECRVFGYNLMAAPITGCAGCTVTITVGLGSAGVS